MLIKKMLQIQEKSGWTDREMAKQLQIDPSTWSLIKRFLHRPGGKVLERITCRFPELKEDISIFLLGDILIEKQPLHIHITPTGTSPANQLSSPKLGAGLGNENSTYKGRK